MICVVNERVSARHNEREIVCASQPGHVNSVSNEDGYSVMSYQDDGHANL